MAIGSILGGLIGSFIPGVGTAIGAGVGGAAEWGLNSLFGQGGVFNPGPSEDQQFAKDQAEFNRILQAIMGSADYGGLERQASQTVQGNSRLFDAAFASSGLGGSGLAADAKVGATNQVLAQLASQINADKLGRAQMAMGLYGQLGQNKANAAQGAAQGDMALLALLGQLAGTKFGGDLLGSLLPKSPYAGAPAGGTRKTYEPDPFPVSPIKQPYVPVM